LGGVGREVVERAPDCLRGGYGSEFVFDYLARSGSRKPPSKWEESGKPQDDGTEITKVLGRREKELLMDGIYRGTKRGTMTN
jgi:hypothetical protein